MNILEHIESYIIFKRNRNEGIDLNDFQTMKDHLITEEEFLEGADSILRDKIIWQTSKMSSTLFCIPFIEQIFDKGYMKAEREILYTYLQRSIYHSSIPVYVLASFVLTVSYSDDVLKFILMKYATDEKIAIMCGYNNKI